jgi:hypothetical protein
MAVFLSAVSLIRGPKIDFSKNQSFNLYLIGIGLFIRGLIICVPVLEEHIYRK